MKIKIERECCEKEDLLLYNGQYEDDEEVADDPDFPPSLGQMRFCRYCGQLWWVGKGGERTRVYPGVRDELM